MKFFFIHSLPTFSEYGNLFIYCGLAVFKKGVYEFTVFINKSRKGLFQDALFAFGGMMVR